MRFFLLFAAVWISHILPAQQISVQVNPENPAVGQAFRVVYQISDMEGSIRPPSFAPLIQQGTFQQQQYVNGRVSFNLTFQLIAREAGTYSIAPLRVLNSKGETVGSSQSLSIRVGNASGPNANNAKNPGTTNAPKTTKAKAAPKILMRLELEPKEVYEGQPFAIDLVLYTKYTSLRNESFSALEIPGVWLQESEEMGKPELVPSSYQGESYYKVSLKRWLAIPQRSGSIQIPTMEATFVVQEMLPPTNVFEQLFGGGNVVTETVEIKSPSASVRVKPLPEKGRPSDFINAVGDFSVHFEAGPCTLSTSDALQMSLKVKGNGNLNLFEFPSPELPQGFLAYPPEVEEKISYGRFKLSGTKKADYILIPQGGGRFVIPPLRFSWFNPSTESYHTFHSDSLNVLVEGAPMNPTLVQPDAPAESSPDFAVPNYQGSPLWPRWFSSTGFWILTLTPLLLLISWPFLWRPLFSRALQKWKRKTPLQKALHNLQNLEKRPDVPLHAYWQVLSGYLNEGLAIPPSEQTEQALKQSLEKHFPKELCAQILGWKQQLEWSSFTPQSDTTVQKPAEQVKTWLLQMDKHLDL